MPRTKSTNISNKSVRKVRKTASEIKGEAKKEEKPNKRDFSFGGMTKEERRTIIENSIGAPSKPKRDVSYKLEDSDFSPSEWVVVLTAEGNLYQEPVPRYMDPQHFIYVLAAIPSNPLVGNKIEFSAEVYKTSFEVKGTDCVINTVDFNGYRKENPYAQAFKIVNGTVKIGGSLVFSKEGKGFDKKEVRSVLSEIIKTLNNYEEK